MTEQVAGVSAALDELEAAVHAARQMPMSSSVLVSRDDVLGLVDQARSALPDQLAEAQEVLASADRVLSDARSRADLIIRSARERADELVSAHELVRAAEERAAALVAEAEATAAGLRREADDYCDRRLADFEIDLGRLMAQVQAGRAKLAGRLAQ